MAQVFQEIRAGFSLEGEPSYVSYPPLIEYFIIKGEQTASPETFLRYLCRKLDFVFKLSGTVRELGQSQDELWDNLNERRCLKR